MEALPFPRQTVSRLHPQHLLDRHRSGAAVSRSALTKQRGRKAGLLQKQLFSRRKCQRTGAGRRDAP
eukprot:1797117-Pleurochrysis_carterae.AAC.1